jgi:hypothetical protein
MDAVPLKLVGVSRRAIDREERVYLVLDAGEGPFAIAVDADDYAEHIDPLLQEPG